MTTAPGRPGPIDRVAVVIPARDEQDGIARCVDAVLFAAAAVRPPVAVVVVADRCTDATAERARAAARDHPTAATRTWTVDVIDGRAGRVGATRDLGVRSVIEARTGGGGPGRYWIACTDADSQVPADWLAVHLELADGGADLVLGTVRPDPADVPAPVLARWRLRHTLLDGHPHVHGANLGVRGDTYLTAGGFPHVACHEDALLADAVRRAGGHVVATGRAPVLTSGRQVGRAPAGLSSYLRELAELDPPA